MQRNVFRIVFVFILCCPGWVFADNVSFTCKGVVTNPAGNPFPKVTVRAYTLLVGSQGGKEDNLTLAAEGVTDDSGSYTVTLAVDPNKVMSQCLIVADHPDMAWGWAYCPVGQNHTRNIQLQPARAFTGRILNTSQEPMANLRVVIKRMTLGQQANGTLPVLQGLYNDYFLKAVTDEDGNFRFQRLPERASLRLRVEGNGDFPSEAERPAFQVLGNAIYYSGQVNKQMFVQESYKISGIVRDPNGHPLEGTNVRLLPFSISPTRTDAMGYFQMVLGGVPRGEDAGFLVLAQQVTQGLVGTETVDQEKNTVDLKLVSGFTVQGKILKEEDLPLAQGTVELILHWGRHRVKLGPTYSCDEQGRFKIPNVPPEQEYTVRASAKGYGLDEKTFYAEGAIHGVIEIAPMRLPAADLVLMGHVVDVNDKPIAKANINAYGSGSRRFYTTSAEDGSFKIENLFPGTFRIMAFTRDGGAMGNAQAEAGSQDLKVVIGAMSPSREYFRPVRREPQSLIGKTLPDVNSLGFKTADLVKGKLILLCFWDMEQRPARRCLLQLKQKAESLKQQGVVILAVQSSEVETTALQAWMEEYEIPFPAGKIIGDLPETKCKWGVRSLPWLILSDKDHKVTAEGFKVSELTEKIKLLE